MDAASKVREIDRATARDLELIAAIRRGNDMRVSSDKAAALRDSSAALRSIGAAHAVIGGVAVGIRSGVPRATLDTDFAVHSTVERRTVIEAFERASFRLAGEYPHSVNMRHPNGEPVQLAFDRGFDEMIERAEVVDFDGANIPVVRTADLIEMKQRAAADPGRRRSKALRDQADVALLRGDVPDPDEGW